MLPFAARAWWMLRYAGHTKVRVLNGGLSAWEKAGGGIEQEPRTYAPCVFTGRIRPDMFASREDVLAALQSADVSTVNVLPLESFEASHIPGSSCLPCLDLMENMESFLPEDQLAQRLNGSAQYKRIITYCGAGIAAAVNAMALVMVGHGNVAVYDGSLYEWLGEGLPVTGTGKWEVWKM
jgi:thiosulfate/3-mercaptopyruvate sulfurtransferase